MAALQPGSSPHIIVVLELNFEMVEMRARVKTAHRLSRRVQATPPPFRPPRSRISRPIRNVRVEIMRIAVLAAGGVGAYFGARLADAGHDVHFIARGAHLAAMRLHGLRVESVHGDTHLPHVNVTDDPAAIGPVDVVLFAVDRKSTRLNSSHKTESRMPSSA